MYEEAGQELLTPPKESEGAAFHGEGAPRSLHEALPAAEETSQGERLPKTPRELLIVVLL